MLLFLSLILISYGNFQDLRYSDGFSPLQLLWPKSWVHSRLSSNSNYVQSVASISIYFSVETSVSLQSSYAAVKMPWDQSFFPCTIRPLNQATNDWTALCPYTFSNSTSGSYGPISFILSSSQSGSLISQDTSIGYLGLYAGKEPQGSALIFYQNQDSGPTASHVVQEIDSLVFDFALPSEKGMFPGDYFLIQPDPSFKIRKNGLSLSWDASRSGVELFSNTKIIVTTDSSQISYVYIAGLSTQVPSGTRISFSVNGWINPSVYTQGGKYNWIISVKRFGTDTVIASFVGNGPNSDVSAGSIQILSWGPLTSSAFGSSNPTVFRGLTCYWNLNFTVPHDVPAGGSISIVYSGIAINVYSSTSTSKQVPNKALSNNQAAAYVSLSDSSKLASVVITGPDTLSVNLDTGVAILAGTSISVSQIGVVRTSSPTVKSIISYTSANQQVDKLLNSKKVIFQDSGFVFYSYDYDSYSNVYLAAALNDDNEILYANMAGLFGLSVNLKPSVSFPAGTIVNIYLPVSIGSNPVERSLVFGASSFAYYKDSSTSPKELTQVTIGTGLISVILKSSALNPFSLFIGSGSSSSPAYIFTPYIPTKDPSEVIVKISYANVVYYFWTTLYFQVPVLSLTASLLCPSAMITGTPMRISFTPNIWQLSSGYSVSVYFTISDAVGSVLPLFSSSGLNNGDFYPCSDLTKTLRIANTDQLYYTATLLPSIDTSITVPLPSLLPDSSYTVRVSINAVSSKNNASYPLMSGNAMTEPTPAAMDTSSGSPDGIDSFSSKIGSALNITVNILTESVDLDNDGTTDQSRAPLSYLLILPSSWTTSDPILNGVSLTSPNFLFPSATYFKENADTGDETSTYKSIKVLLTAGWYTKPAAPFLFAVGWGSSFPAWKCVVLSFNSEGLTTLSSTPSAFSVSDYSPRNISSYTYSSRVAQTISLAFNPGVLVGTNSVISIGLNGWKGVLNSGFKVFSGGNFISGNLNGMVWTSSPVNKTIEASTQFLVFINGAILPSPSRLMILGFSFIYISYQNAAYASWTESGSQTITFVKPVSPAIQSLSKASMWVFPNVPGAQSVYFGLSFTSLYLIPSGSTVSISGSFSDHPLINLDLFCSHLYSSASVNKRTLSIVTSQNISPGNEFTIVLDSAFNIDFATKPNTIYPVLVSVQADDGSVLIRDTTYSAPFQYYNLSLAPTPKIKQFTFKPSSLQAGNSNLYTFSFQVDTDLQEKIWVNLDASADYNAIPGPSFSLADYGSGFKFLYAKDDLGKRMMCYVVHWVISCFFSLKYLGGSIVPWTMLVTNGQSSGYFNLFITDLGSNIIAQPYYGTGQALSFKNEVKGFIDPYFVYTDYSSDPRESTANINVLALIDADTKQGASFWLTFPKEFDISSTNPDSSICSLTYFNNDSESNITDNVLEDSQCSQTGNSVIFNLPFDKKFTSKNWTNFTVRNIWMPSGGASRSNYIYELSPQSSFYSSQFEILYVNRDSVVEFRSFDNLHSAYLGFNVSPYQRILVNDGNSIQISPGILSGPFRVSTPDGLMWSQNVSVSGKQTEGKSVFLSNNGRYILTFTSPFTVFYVGSPYYTPLGVYVIHWNIKESAFPGTKQKYLPPLPTLIEVSPKFTYKILLPAFPIKIIPGVPSLPIEVSIESSVRLVLPFNGVSLSFKAQNSSLNITYSKSKVLLSPISQRDYFNFTCSNCANDTEYAINLNLEGPDTAAFTVIPFFTFTVSPSPKSSIKTEIALNKITANGFTYDILSSNYTVVTWCVVSDDLFDVSLLNYSSLIKKTWILGGPNDYGQIPVEQQISRYNSEVESALQNSSNYYEFCKAIRTIRRRTIFTGQRVIVPGGNSVLDFRFLIPDSLYWVITFIGNQSENTTYDLQNVTTGNLPSHALVTISNTKTPLDLNNLTYTFASFLKYQYLFINVHPTSMRRLSDYSVTIYSNIFSDLGPYDAINANPSYLSALFGGAISNTPITSSNYSAAAFEFSVWDKSSEVVLSLNFSSTVDGALLCSVLNGTNLQLTTDEVYQLSNFSGSPSKLSYVPVSALQLSSFSLNFTEIGYVSGRYSVSCIICNEFPGFPICSKPVSTEFMYKASGEMLLLGINILFFFC